MLVRFGNRDRRLSLALRLGDGRTSRPFGRHLPVHRLLHILERHHLADLDGFVEREVLEPFDRKSLNEDVAAFRATVPTTENLCIEIFRRLKAFPKAKLERVRIQETSNNSFEYAGDNPEGFER